MKNKILIIGCFLFFFSNLTYSSNREIININNDWKFKKGEYNYGYDWQLIESGWEKINIPHTWNVWDSFDDRDDDPDYEVTEYYYRGPGWYRKKINIPGTDKGKRIFIEFEAANVVTDVWVNEEHVGNHIGGYAGFKFDITEQIKFGEDNLIAVRVDNSFNYEIPPHRADYTMYGGIYRDVYLVKTNAAYIKRSLINTSKVSKDEATITIKTLLKSTLKETYDGELEIMIYDPEGSVISNQNSNISLAGSSQDEFIIDFDKVNNPKLWSPENPNIYSAKVVLKSDGKIIDEINEHFGLRWYSIDADDGFFLNGEYIKLKGVNRHQDRYGYGNALTNEMHREDFRMIKDMGANFVRLAHYQQDPVVLDMCDSLGLLVWEEIPVITSVGKAKFKENAKNMLREMITQHYNHPSVIMWGLMNETVRTQPDDELFWNVDLCKELSILAKELDPKRYTTQAQFRERGEDVLKYTDIRGWNKYFGWYYDTFDEFGRFMDEQKAKAPDQPFVMSEYGAGSKRGFHVENPTFPDFSEEWALEFHRSHWKQIEERRWIAGSAVWNMFDFGSDEKAGNQPHINQKGLVSFDRKPKDVYYFYQSIWSDKPMVYIVSRTWLNREGKKDEKKKLEIFSNCDEVELFLEGKSIGVDNEAPFVWNVFYKEGKNIIKAVGKKGDIEVINELKISYKIKE